MIALDAGTTETPPPQYEEASRWFRGRVPMTQAAFDLLIADAQRRAFTLAGAAALTVVSDVWRSLDATLTDGRTLRDFKRDVAPALLAQWSGSVANPAWRMEVIFRNATQRAYTHGRVEQLRDPAVARVRPFWLFDAIGDARTSEICKALDGTVAPAGSAWWASHTPPCHHACRSTVRGLRAGDPRVRDAAPPPDTDAQEGFGVLPEADDWKPREGDYPPEVWAAYQRNPQAYRTPDAPVPSDGRVRMVGPVVSGAAREITETSPRASAPRMIGGPAKAFSSLPVSSSVEGVEWADHDAVDYPENHITEGYYDRISAASRTAVAAMTPERESALREYTSTSYEPMNAYLRNPEAFRDRKGSAEAERMAALARVTREAMSTMPRAPSGMVLFRGVSLSKKDDRAQMNALASGDEVTFPSFGSFSRSPYTARVFASRKDASVTYRIRNHQSGVLMDGVSDLPGEREVLFPPGTRFRIVARQRVGAARLVVDLEEITDD